MKLSGLQQCLGQMRSYLGSVIIIFDHNIIIILLLLYSASIISMAMLVGSLLGGYCGGRFGPRLTTLLTCLPSALGWLTMALSPNLALLLAGRVLCGVNIRDQFSHIGKSPKRGVGGETLSWAFFGGAFLGGLLHPEGFRKLTFTEANDPFPPL